ncbi:hypothetical protein CCHL11_06996 [Colletotrichum chlorophyti]|uniref:Uncharacterized protein n=1 Tax=Colletotrichum chlorophyti TaxID=708187 RepID=A0A1Q8RBW2_9PEZI|nr:hypothetical protein CCHL11_06996 [Colletotrichum chlorophyti]
MQYYLSLFSVALAALAVTAQGRDHSDSSSGDEAWVPCLCEEEAWDIARRWLDIFSTGGGVSSKAELATIVSPDIKSYDYTYGPPVIGIDRFWEVLIAPTSETTTNMTQTPTFLLHTCDQIAFNWRFTAATTGFNSSVPAGTTVSLTGNDILRVDLETGLISNATSNGDWILLARQLGGNCNI